MRKPDDDLKIDISELFGGDLSGPSESLEETPATAEAPSSPPPSPAEAETQYQKWLAKRNAELEAKSQALERKLQQAPPQPLEPPRADIFTAQELLSAPAPIETPAGPEAKPVIDFNAPIAPPFMGAPKTPAPPPPPEAATPASEETPTPEASAEDLKRIHAEHEFLMLYDEFRNIIAYELKDLVGERKTLTMLTRTVELAREKYPEIFRNTNWDPAGNLLEDGSLDGQRLLDNKNTLDPHKADEVLDLALSGLLKLRLQAVEKGLGAGLKNKIRARMYQWISEKTQKAPLEGKNPAPLKRLNAYVTAT